MGFGTNIKSNAVPEWRDYYVDYDKLRNRLRHKNFKSAIYNELTKVNNFYSLLEKKAIDEKNKIFDNIDVDYPNENFNDLRDQTEIREGDKQMSKQEINFLIRNKNTSETETEDRSEDRSSTEQRSSSNFGGVENLMKLPRGLMKRKKEKNITEFLHSLVKITAYKNLNVQALLKLAKKYSEIRKNSKFYGEFVEYFKQMRIYRSKRIEYIRNAIKRLYKRLFAKNQPGKAKTIFRRIRRGSESSDWYWCLILSGLLIGITACLLLLKFFPIEDSENPKDPNSIVWATFEVFLGFLLFGICNRIFKNVQINYKFIFNFDVCSSMNNATYMLTISILAFISVGCYTLGYFTFMDYFGFYIFLIECSALFLPLDYLFYNSRLYLLGAYAHALIKPFSTIRFRHFYFIDVAQSFSFTIRTVLNRNSYITNYGITAVIIVFPLVRILQCLKRYTMSRLVFPHIANSIKYLVSICFIVSNLILETKFDSNDASSDDFKKLVIILGLINMFFGIFWDMFVDWVLIRNRYLYPRSLYIFIVLFNILCKFTWTFKFIFDSDFKILQSLAEIVRRFLWTLIRVEVEHLNNCDALKTKNAIYLTAGELFYKRDQEDLPRVNNDTEKENNTETEYENTETDYEYDVTNASDSVIV